MKTGKKWQMANEYHLSDLDIIYYSEIKFDTFILPLKFDIANIKEEDVLISMSFMNQFKKDKIKPQDEDKSELDNMKIVEINSNVITLSYKELEYKYEFEELDRIKKIKYCIKFIDTESKLFDNNNSNLLEYLKTDNMYDFLMKYGLNEHFFLNLYSTTSYWLDLMVSELNIIISSALKMKDEKGTDINYAIAKLKGCYDMNMKFFRENEGVSSFQNLSYREQILKQNYENKMHTLENNINENARKEAEKSRKDKPQSNRRKSSKF